MYVDVWTQIRAIEKWVGLKPVKEDEVTDPQEYYKWLKKRLHLIAQATGN